ncbi:hypothetical protein DRN76_03660 [Methanosarcinales archaeon]|nr:MAG: hypothetical protein DRN76_03660 [Methanosarcinales archaeon]
MRTMPQEKHIERFLILKFDETDELCRKAHSFCNELINYFKDSNLLKIEGYPQIQGLASLLKYTDDFVLPVLPFLQDSVIQYQKITGYIDALDEFLDEYRKNTVGYKRRNSHEFHEVLELKKRFVESYKRILKKIDKEIRKNVEKELPELMISVYGYIVHRITHSDVILNEFNVIVIPELIEDIKYTREHKQDFDAFQRLNNKINAITCRFLYDIESEFLTLLGYEEGDDGNREKFETGAVGSK